MKFLPEGADTAAASVRATVSDSVRAEIEAKLATRPEPGVAPVCRICEGLARKSPWRVHRHLPAMRLSARAEEVVWHLRSWCVCRRRPFWGDALRLLVDGPCLAVTGRSSRRGIFCLSISEREGRGAFFLESVECIVF